MREHQFSWLGTPPEDDDDQTLTTADAPYVSITGPHSANGWWDVSMNNVPGYDDGMARDDDTGSAWSTVAMVMCENGATPTETDALAAAAPACLSWCFDGQVGMYAVHEDELWED